MDDRRGGILHEEYHSPAFTERGGTIEMVQFWVNLPAKDKTAEPGCQTLLDAQIPSVDLPEGVGRVRVIAADFEGQRGPARTFTPMNVWDVRISQGGVQRLEAKEGQNACASGAAPHGAGQRQRSGARRATRAF